MSAIFFSPEDCTRHLLTNKHFKKMDKKAELLRLIPEAGILPLYFYKDTEVSIEVLRAVYRGGSGAGEYTKRGEAA